MNDAEFCSDAHRHSYAEEQQLAMRRLTETQPPLHRAQRLPAAPSAPVDAPRMAHMAIMGEIMSPGPDPVPPPFSPLPDPAPAGFRGALQFVERDHRVSSGAPFSDRTFPVPVSPRNVSIRGAVGAERPSPLRVMPPRRGGVPSPRVGQGLPPGTVLRPVPSGPAGSRPRVAVLLTPVPGAGLRAIPGGCRPRKPGLPESRLLAALPARPATGRVSPLQRDRFEPASPGHPGFPLALPTPALAVIAPPSAEPVPEVWETLEQNGLAALLVATGIPPVLAAGPAARPLPVHAEPYDAFLPELEARLVGATHSTGIVRRLDPAVALRRVPVPAPAGHAALPKAKVRPVAGLPVRRMPEHAGPAQRLALALVTGTRPIAPPAPAPLSSAPAASPRPLAPVEVPPLVAARRPRSRGVDLSIVSLGASLAIAPPRPARRPLAPAASGDPCSVAPHPGVPAARFAAGLRRLADVVSLVAPVRPLAADARRHARPFPAIPPQLSPELLRHLAPVSLHVARSSSARAGCLPVSAPAPLSFAVRPQSVDYIDLIPAPGLPVRAPRPSSRSLRRFSVRLFRVPGGQATPRDTRIRPLAIGMDLWASTPAICSSGLAWDDGKPRPKARRAPRLPVGLLGGFSSSGVADAWSKMRRLPSDLKWITMVVPLILGIWVFARPSDEPASRPVAETRASRPADPPAEPADRPSGEEDRAAISPAAAPIPIAKAEPVAPVLDAPRTLDTPKEDPAAPVRPLPAANPSAWDTFTARIASRASVDLVEDFQRGLSLWDGRGEWARTWSYDRAGTVRPGHMAFFQPSVGLRDYVLEMKASIDRRAIQWLVRASSPQNYHFARLNVTPGAPLTRLEFERWSVVNGKIGRVTRLPLPHAGANQTLFDIRVEARGDTITTYLQDQVIDTYSDPRLPEGGIGLVGAGDDRARIYGLRVYHQNDFLGKLCSFFASPPIANQGSE